MWSFQNGSITFSSVGSGHYIRPVINVMAEDGFVEGTNGTVENPYILK